MYKGKRVAVVVAAQNVEPQIIAVIQGIPEFVDDIIVVEDAGTEATERLVQKLREPRLSLVQHAANQGVAGGSHGARIPASTRPRGRDFRKE